MGHSSTDLAALDIVDPALFSQGPPHELFARMRAEAPVRWNPHEGDGLGEGGGFWSVTRHADVTGASKDTETFSSHRAGIFLHPDQVNPLDLNRNLLLFKDPPEHTKYRKILQKAFTPRTVRDLEDGVRARMTKLLDEAEERIGAEGSCDLVETVTVPLPLGVLMELMGLPESDMDQLFRWTEEIEAAQRSPEPNGAVETFGELALYLNRQIERQASSGTDSLVTQLRAAEVDGEKLTDPEILVFFGLLMFAGNDTTRNTASTGTLALLRNRDQWEVVRSDPESVPNAVEEILRHTTVVNHFSRTATRDTELGGQAISEGDKVMLWYTSASRDEEVYDDPDTLEVSRTAQDHAAFGGGGRHFCMGAGLARLELKVFFEELTRRFPDLELAGEPEYVPSSWAHGLTSLPVASR